MKVTGGCVKVMVHMVFVVCEGDGLVFEGDGMLRKGGGMVSEDV